MSFKELTLEIGYDSDEVDIANAFYKPVLSKAILYQRLSGYFSSTTFAIAIKETLDFVKRNGKIKLVTSAEISENDLTIFNDVIKGETKQFESIILKKIHEESNEIFKDCNSLMGWMLSNQINGEPQLEIKIAIPITSEGKFDFNSLYHQKVGIFYDNDNNIISFEGSVNETGKGWTSNIEKFKISTNWNDESDKKRIDLDIKTFEKFWNDESKRTRVIELPDAIKNELMKIRPKSTKEFYDIIERLEKNLTKIKKKVDLRDYQQDAIQAWKDNNYHGIFEMATGSGKTFAALAAINNVLNKFERLIVIISVPYTHLVEQWDEVFDFFKMNFEIDVNLKKFKIQKCYGEIKDWKIKLKRRIRDINEKDLQGNYFLNGLVIFTTHNTLSSSGFIELIDNTNANVMLIADEVHAVGSELRLKGLNQKYNLRLGLSATPNRYFDDEGTKKLVEYFDRTVYELSIGDAIKRGFLSKYDYNPQLVDLTDEEFIHYKELTVKLAKKLSIQGKYDDEELSSFIEGERASIISAAEKKYDTFKEILNNLGTLNHCLIYCHEKQLERVKEILYDRNIIFHQITYRETY